MKEHETTRRARAASEISFSESGEIIEKAKRGDPIAKQEVENLARAFKESGFIEEVTKMVESISAPLSGFAEDVLHKYILTFNKLYETDFKTLDEIEEYIKENKLELKNEREVSDIIETSVVSPHDYVRTLGALTDRVFENTITLRNGKQGKYKVKLFTPTQRTSMRSLSMPRSITIKSSRISETRQKSPISPMMDDKSSTGLSQIILPEIES